MPDGPLPLNFTEVRVLGSLIEKEITTPDYYPLTLNALTLACNQTSNRDPVMSLDDQTVGRALDSLREKRLAVLFKGADSRVPKYSHQFAVNDSDLGRPEVAVMCVLMLRVPRPWARSAAAPAVCMNSPASRRWSPCWAFWPPARRARS